MRVNWPQTIGASQSSSYSSGNLSVTNSTAGSCSKIKSAVTFAGGGGVVCTLLPVILGSVSTGSARRVRTSILGIADRMAPYFGASPEVDCTQLPWLSHHLAPDKPAGDVGLMDKTGARE